NRNDRVGKSGLEEQYEDVLRGRKEQVQYTTTKSGKVIDSEVVVPGERGKDLVLTIDMELQKRVDDIVKKELNTAIKKHPYANRFMEDALAVVINPKTGELLAVSGQYYNRDKTNSKMLRIRHFMMHIAPVPRSREQQCWQAMHQVSFHRGNHFTIHQSR